jgi:Cu2+-exporting ATPase
MKVKTHVSVGTYVAVGAPASGGNGHNGPGALNGFGKWSPDELLQSSLREMRPWFVFPADRARGLDGGKQDQPTSRSFAVVDRAVQEFVQRWIDPLFGERSDQKLQDMGLALDAGTSTPRERFINRHLVIGLTSAAATVAGMTVMPPLLWVGAAGILYITLMPASNAYRALVQKRKLTTSLTATLSFWGAWLGGYYLPAAIGGLVYATGEKLLFATQNRARQDLVTVYSQQPRTAWLLIDGQEVEVPFRQVKVGDTVVAHAGQTIPVDGAIVGGIATIDQHTLTGEAQPVERSVGDPVLATTVVLTGSIHIRVEKAGRDTAATEIARIFSSLDSHQRSVESKAAQFGDRAVIPTLLMSGAALPLLGASSAIALLRFPLAASIKTTSPIAMLEYLNVLSRRGVLVKDGRSLELLTEIDTVVFDKTGTLTMSQPHVAEVHALNGLSPNETLALAAMAEQHQGHPIARAILTEAHARGLLVLPLDDAQVKVGFGVEAHVDGKVVAVGSARFMALQGIALPEAVDGLQQRCTAAGHSLVLVAVNGQVAGAVELHATIRPEAQQLVHRLHEQGLKVHILSGDQAAPTQRLAEELGIDHYFANVLPEGKAAVIEELQAAGRSVCFVGDGINDAIALKKAHVSVSLRGATTVAIDAAQIVLLEEKLDHFVPLLQIAADLDATQRRSFDITRWLRVALVGGVFGVLFLDLGVWWSVAVMGANTAACLINATAPARKFRTELNGTDETVAYNPA